MSVPELVVLLDDDGAPVGTAEKALVHSTKTPLHLAFSCYLMNDAGELLATRRALAKATWAGVWTNSFCGHPAPGETFESAIGRRAEEELGTSASGIRLALPDFRYTATDASGIVEREICPVFVAQIDGELAPDPSEVSQWRWVTPQSLARSARATPFAFSPWMVEQLPQLIESGALDERGPA